MQKLLWHLSNIFNFSTIIMALDIKKRLGYWRIPAERANTQGVYTSDE